MKHGNSISCLALTTLLIAGISTAGAWGGDEPRIEVTAARWTWPPRLAFVNDAMRCTFAATNETTQLRMIEIARDGGGWLPLTGRAGPLLGRHPDAVDLFSRLENGFLMERRLPAAAHEGARGVFLRTGARLRLTGREPRIVMDEDIRFLRAERSSAECFSIDFTPAQPTSLHWIRDGVFATTNLIAEGLFRFSVDALALAGSNGSVVVGAKLPDDAEVSGEVLVRRDRHGTRLSLVITDERDEPGREVSVRLDLRLLPPGMSQPDIVQRLREVRP